MDIAKIKELFKFSWAQAWSDKCGKSSGTAWTGWFLSVVGGLMAMYGAATKYSDAMMYGLGFATLGAGLLGYRKSQAKHDTDGFPAITEPEPIPTVAAPSNANPAKDDNTPDATPN